MNRSGTEYACVQGWGIFDGPSNKASVAAMAKWHINFVRIPLNEDCWLGINGVKRKYSGARYVRAIVNYVNLLHSYGIYAELSLMWGAPGKQKATYQPDAPDEDHSPAMWASMARTFKNDSNVILAPWGETTVNESCFLLGCRNQAAFAHGPFDHDKQCHDTCYASAGMAQAVRVMRREGYAGVISIPGVDYANDLTGWLRYEPHDSLHQIVAEAHVYQGQICSTISCFDKQFEPVTKRVPLIWGETGQAPSNCSTSWIGPALQWALAHGVGYAVWTWDTWGSCEALIKNYAGTPANAFGALVKSLDLRFSLPVKL